MKEMIFFSLVIFMMSRALTYVFNAFRHYNWEDFFFRRSINLDNVHVNTSNVLRCCCCKKLFIDIMCLMWWSCSLMIRSFNIFFFVLLMVIEPIKKSCSHLAIFIEWKWLMNTLSMHIWWLFIGWFATGDDYYENQFTWMWEKM